MSKAAKAPRYEIKFNDSDEYELFDRLYEIVLETFEFATDAESACFLKNDLDNTE